MVLDIEELVAIGRARAKAQINLPPRLRDRDATVVFVIGSRQQFNENPLVVDRILFNGEVIDLDTPTTQSVGVIDDQIIVQITLPKIETPAELEKLDEIVSATEKLLFIAAWFTSSLIKQFAINKVIIEVQKIRLARAKTVLALPGVSDRTRFRALVRTARTGRSIVRRETKAAAQLAKILKPIRIVGRIGVRLALKSILIIGVIVDIAIVTVAVVQASKQRGPAAGVGALVGGVADAITLGFLEKQTTSLGQRVEQGLTDITSSDFFSDDAPVTFQVG